MNKLALAAWAALVCSPAIAKRKAKRNIVVVDGDKINDVNQPAPPVVQPPTTSSPILVPLVRRAMPTL